ncbi:MAG: SDR family NAD(P)-dependent oxidoreductase [Candidatus Dormibacteria bacterium]
MKLSGCRVLVTGASRGIGEATALELGARGAKLVLVARSRDDLDRVAARVAATGAAVEVLVADMSVEAEVRKMATDAQACFDGIDVLVNNAGLGLSGLVSEVPVEDFRYVLEVNTISTLVAAQALLPGMLARRRGGIVNVASVASHATTPGLGAYAATKHAIKAWTDALRMETRGSGVFVTSIFPGPIRTGFVANTRGERGEFAPKTPIGVPASEVGVAIARAIEHETAEVFVPRYWQAAIGFNSVAPQLLRTIGPSTTRRFSAVVDRLAKK